MADVLSASTEAEAVERYSRYMAMHWRIGYEPMSGWRLLRSWLPKPFKPDKDATMFLAMHGLCSDLVKASMWLLDGYMTAAEHHVIGRQRAHSALSIRLSTNAWVFTDPYAGLMFRDGDRFLALRELIDRLRQGGRLADYLVPLREKGIATGMYQNITTAAHAREPDYLDAEIELPVAGKSHWQLGEIDGSSEDIASEATKRGLTTHLFYIGARFSRKFRFTYRFPDDRTSYRLRIYLTEPASRSQLPGFTIAPTVSGRMLEFLIHPGGRTLVVDPSAAGSGGWYGIDALSVEALPVQG